MIVQDQSDVIAFLSRPAAYGEGVESVTRMETHISEIFLAGTRAYKLKRAVRYPYLDFSTPERRRAACEAEVAVNRRTAPDLYLGTRAVTRAPGGGLALGGDGPAVDWLVVMRRFDQDSLLDRMALAGRLEASLAAKLAEAVARFHESAEPRPGFGGARAMDAVVRGNAAAFAECAAHLPDPALAERLNALARREVRRVAPWLEARRVAGLVRRCHGDLHLGNVFVEHGRPTLFDAIEFSEDLASIDVFYDLAFVLMDLDHRNLRPLANVVLNRYLEITCDCSGLAVLPLFLSCRAAVRAHVGATMAGDAARAGRSDEAARRAGEAGDYLARALAYLDPPPPSLVAVGGFSGTGKSRLAQALAPEVGPAPGAVLLRSDVIRKRAAGVEPTERLPQKAYRAAVTRRVYDRLATRAREALAAGHAVLADAVHARPGQRQAIEAAARDMGVPFAGLWLEAPAAVLEARVAGRRGDASDATAAVVRRQLRYRVGTVTWRRLDASGTPEETLDAARRALTDAGILGGRRRRRR